MREGRQRKKIYKTMYGCLICLYVCAWHVYLVPTETKEDPQIPCACNERLLWAVTWVLGVEHGSSSTESSVLNFYCISCSRSGPTDIDTSETMSQNFPALNFGSGIFVPINVWLIHFLDNGGYMITWLHASVKFSNKKNVFPSQIQRLKL